MRRWQPCAMRKDLSGIRPRPWHGGPRPVATSPTVERHYDPDREAMLAGFRVVLGLPRRLPGRSNGGS